MSIQWLRLIDENTQLAVRAFWKEARSQQNPVQQLEAYYKGWDRLARARQPTADQGVRFAHLAGDCSRVAHDPSVLSLLREIGDPIKNDTEPLTSRSTSRFDDASRAFEQHRAGRLRDEKLMTCVGWVLWVVRSNASHGFKAPDLAPGPNKRDVMVAQLAGDVFDALYVEVFAAEAP
jgi:hypothetical protein